MSQKYLNISGETHDLDQEAVTAKLRDRVLLYLRGMDVPPLLALELALECLRRVEAGQEPREVGPVMKELHALLRENKLHTGWIDRPGPPRGSMPALNRCSMIAEPMEFSLWPGRRRPAGGPVTPSEQS